MKNFTCKFCKESLDFNGDRDFIFCPYCGKMQVIHEIQDQKPSRFIRFLNFMQSNFLLAHLVLPFIFSGSIMFGTFMLVFIFAGLPLNMKFLLWPTLFGAAGYEIGNVLAIKFPRDNSYMWPLIGLLDGTMMGFLFTMRMIR